MATPILRFRSSPLAAGIIVGLLLACGANFATAQAEPDTTGPRISQTRNLIQEWVEMRRLIANQKRDWAQNELTLKEQIRLKEQELAAVREQIAAAEAEAKKNESEVGELETEAAGLSQVLQSLSPDILRLENRVKALLGRFPTQLVQDVDVLSNLLPKTDKERADTGLTKRFFSVLGILERANAFNRTTRVETEVRKLPDGSSAQVDTLYFGLGHAFFANATGSKAGVGRATDTAWVWSPADAAGKRIAQAISIATGEGDAAYVNLPLTLKAKQP